MSAVATRTRPRIDRPRPVTVTRIRMLRRGEDDRLDWVTVGEVTTAAEPHVALRNWLLDTDPEPVAGEYEAANDLGGHHRQHWTPPA